MRYLSIYTQFIRLRLRTMAEYRKAFLLGSVPLLVSYGTQFILIWVMVNQFKTMGGWSTYEVIFLFALNLFSYSVAGSFFYGLNHSLSYMVQSGDLDEVLTKPINPLLYMICRDFEYSYFAHVTLCSAVIVLCIVKLGIPVTLINVLFLIIVLLSGALIHSAGFVATAVPSFWIIQNNLSYLFYWNLKNFVQYPISIYNRFLQVILTLIVPYAFINFYPAQFFLDKNDFLIFHPVFQYLSPVVGVTLFLLTYKFWNVGVRHYKSTGS